MNTQAKNKKTRSEITHKELLVKMRGCPILKYCNKELSKTRYKKDFRRVMSAYKSLYGDAHIEKLLQRDIHKEIALLKESELCQN